MRNCLILQGSIMSKILIANSLNPNAQVSLEVGLDLASKLNLEPIVLHGDKMADSEKLNSVLAHINLEVQDHYVENIHNANLKKFQEQLNKIKNPFENVRFESKSGESSELLINEAKGDDIQFIILGHNSNKNLVDKFLGSVSESVIHKSQKPILIVKDSRIENLKKIVLAYDFSYHCDQSFDWAIKFAQATGACIEVVNIVPCYYQGYQVSETLQNNFDKALESLINETVEINQKN